MTARNLVLADPAFIATKLSVSSFFEPFQGSDWDTIEVSSADFSSPDFSITDDLTTGWATVTEPVEPFDFSTPTASLSDDLSTW